jgi:hypothetical protein
MVFVVFKSPNGCCRWSSKFGRAACRDERRFGSRGVSTIAVSLGDVNRGRPCYAHKSTAQALLVIQILTASPSHGIVW